MVIIHKKKNETAEEKEARILKENELAMGIQDEYQAKGFELVSWVQDHKRIVGGLIVAILVAGLSFGAFSFYQRRKSEQASSAFIEIIRKYEDSDSNDKDSVKAEEIQKELAKVASDFKKTKIASLANMWAGHLALANRDHKNSVEFYQSALKNMDSKDELYPLLLIGLGYAEDSNGQKAEALTRFVQVAQFKHNAGKDLALFEAARLAKELNDNENAKKYLTQLLEEFPSSIYEKKAKRLKESL